MMNCRVCKESKNEHEFAKKRLRKDGSLERNTICKICQKNVSKNHYKQNKPAYLERNKKKKKDLINFIKDYKFTRKCERCGFLGSDNPSSLDFHHIKKEDKKHNVSYLVSYSKGKIEKEIEKCMLLCANCHRIIEFEEKNNS